MPRNATSATRALDAPGASGYANHLGAAHAANTHDNEVFMPAVTGYVSVSPSTPRGYFAHDPLLQQAVAKLEKDLPGFRCYRKRENDRAFWVAERGEPVRGKMRFEHTDPIGLVELVRASAK